MRVLLLLLSIFSFSHAVSILDTKVYERTDRVDIMLMFDTPYQGKISQKKDSNGIILHLEDVLVAKEVIKPIHSTIIQNFILKPEITMAKVYLHAKEPFGIVISKTSDGYGLRLRLQNEKHIQKDRFAPAKVNTPSTTSTKAFELDSRYYIALFALIVIIFGLFLLKKIVLNSKAGNWLAPPEAREANIVFQRGIDANNKVVLLEYKGKSYLMLVGNSNVLLDEYENDKAIKKQPNISKKQATPAIKSEKNFEQEFLENKQKLDEFLKLSAEKKDS